MEEKKRKRRLGRIFHVAGASFTELQKNDPLRMAAATAFFTTFALPPILFILIQLFGLFLERRSVGREMIQGISNTLGPDGGAQVRQVIRSIRGFNQNWYVIVIGFIFLLFVATTLFMVIRNSVNQIWQIAVREHRGILFVLAMRLRSLAVIVFAGLLFLADIIFESLEVIGSDWLDHTWSGTGIYFRSFIHEVGGVVIVSLWFIALFRYIADARPAWKVVIRGGILTALLFTAGKLLLQFLLVNSNIGALYGTGGSLVLILLFVFYSSFILYYGACFIQVYSQENNLPILPTQSAYHYKIEPV